MTPVTEIYDLFLKHLGKDDLLEIDEAIGSRLYEMSKNYLATMKGEKLNYRIYGS